MNFKKTLTTALLLFTFSLLNNIQAQSCSGTTNLTAPTGTFSDGSATNLDYSNNLNCQWLIQPTGATIIRLNFNQFDTENCCDEVLVYDGNTTSAPLIGTFKGDSIPPIITSTGGSLLVVFTTDGSITSTGWEASYISSFSRCFNNLTLTTPTGTVEDGSGALNYQNNLNCSWIIEPFRATSVTATFNSFNVNNGDTLFIYDGVNSSSPLLASLTGSTIPTLVTTTVGIMYVEFSTDGATVNSGWEFDYTSTIPQTCVGLTTLTTTSGTIEDGSLTGNYDNNLTCSWLIQPLSTPTVINLDMITMDLATGFSGDVITIYDGPNTSGNLIRTFSGTFVGGTVTAYSGSMFIEFNTDATTTGPGWEATYNTSSTFCVPQTVFTAASGNFRDGSPTGQNYLSNTDCEWLIQPADPNLAVTLNLFQFDTELGNDTVTIYDGATTAAPILATLSGNNPTIPNLLSTGNAMLVTFKTNGTTVASGWRAFYNSQLLPTCNGTTTLTSASGTFTDGSVSTDDYAPNMNCSWLIQPPGASAVTLNFNRFDTQNNFDSITVFDGPNNNSPILGSYSGQAIPAAIFSSGSSLFLEFTSNATQNSTGWEASYKSTNNQCFTNLSLTTQNGLVSDGSGVLNYQNNLNCTWIIEPPKATSITAAFSTFNVANTGDTLFIYDGANASAPLLGSFTGTSAPTSVTATSGLMYVNFVTDNASVSSGWDFNYTSIIPVSCSGTTTLTAFSGTINDGSFANNHDNNLNCKWLIQPPGNLPVITFDMTSIDLALSSSPNDRVTIYDGTDSLAPVIGAFFGKNLRNTVTAYSGSMFIQFLTNVAITSQGWEGVYNASSSYCSPLTTFTAYRGNFTDGSPAFQNYLDNSDCSWLIQPANPNKAVNLTLGRFDTELRNDTVTVYDGATTSDPILGTFSGAIPTNPKLLSTGGSMLVTFKSNGSTTATGFIALYEEQQIPACNGTTTFTSATGTFDDGTTPTTNYAPNLNCSWLIQPTGAALVSLNFNRFDVQNNFDFINVYDGTSNTAPLIGTYTGTTIPTAINSTGPNMFVEFTTNNTLNETGWEATYTATTSQCFTNVPFLTNTGTITDGSGTSNYQNNLNCSWSIAPPFASSITATFNSFAISAGDSLYFYDGNSATAPLIGAYSGTTLPAAITSTVGFMFIEFSTNGTTNSTGWEFDYTTSLSVSCAGTTTLTAPTMTFSDGSAATTNYNNNLNCSWLIQPAGNPAIISFNMNRLDLASGDRVRVHDGNSSAGLIIRSYAGTNPGNTVFAYSGAMYIEFSTGSGSTATGWEGTYNSSFGFCLPNLIFTGNNGFFDDGSSFGQNYLDNSNCEYLIQPAAANRAVVLNWLTFDTEAGNDTVTVYDGATTSDPILGTFSGTSIPPTVISTGGSMLLTFKSNGTINAAGWRADFSTQARPACSGLTSLTAASGTFNDGSTIGNNYVENSNCQWLINPLGATSVNLTFNYFQTQVNLDVVTVYDGATTSDPVLGTFSGNTVPSAISSTGGAVLVTFTSSNRFNLNGFEISYTSLGASTLDAPLDTVYVNAGTGSTGSFALNSNLSWTTSDNRAWLIATPVNGTGNSTINLTAIQANFGLERSAQVFINSTSPVLADTVVVIQRASNRFINANPDTLKFSAISAPSQNITLNSNVIWSLSSAATWISSTPNTGTNNGTPSITLQDNTTGNIRTDYILITESLAALTDTVWIQQDTAIATPPLPTLSVNPSSLSLAQAMSSSNTFTINSNTSWQTTSGASWLTVTNPTLTADTGTVQVTANTANLNVLPRSSFVAIQDITGTLLDTVFISQAGTTPILNGSPDTIVVGAYSGNDGTLTISSTSNWTALEGNSWFDLSQNSGNGTMTVIARTNSNNPSLNSQRISFIAIEDALNNLRDTVIVIQDTIVPTGLAIVQDTIRLNSINGSSNTFTLSTNLGWAAVEGASWITTLPKSGTGSGIISIISNSANVSATERVSFVEVSSTGAAINIDTVWVIQEGSQGNLSINPSLINLNFSSGSFATANITSNISWNVTNPASWLTLSQLAGNNNATLTFTANSNNLTGSTRTAIITIDGAGASTITITVNQIDASTPIFTTSTDTVYVNNSQGSTGTFDILANMSSWTLAENTSWLLLNPMNGTELQTVTALVATRNVTGTPRYANITASSPGFTDKSVVVSQKGVAPLFEVLPDSLLIGADSLSFREFSINSNLPSWRVAQTADWLEITPNSGAFIQRVTAKAIKSNKTSNQRSETVQILSPPSVPVNLIITQDTITTIGLNENTLAQSLNFYPNPTNGELTIEIGTEFVATDRVYGRIYNLLGEELPITIDFRKSNKLNIDLQGQAEGIYILMIRYNNEVISKKISLIK